MENTQFMTELKKSVPISNIILDETIYPRSQVDLKRAGMFAENIRDGFKFDPIEVEPHPDREGSYRILDGAHRWKAYTSRGHKLNFSLPSFSYL